MPGESVAHGEQILAGRKFSRKGAKENSSECLRVSPLRLSLRLCAFAREFSVDPFPRPLSRFQIEGYIGSVSPNTHIPKSGEEQKGYAQNDTFQNCYCNRLFNVDVSDCQC